MERTEQIKHYLNNKHKGGENNQRGGLFEDFYAVYQIVSCLAKYKYSFEGVKFQTQLEDTFVDDLLIAHPNQNVYHQLKNTKELSWGSTDKIGNIAFDFAGQISDCKERDEDFALKLVYSLKDSNIGEHIPKAINEHSTVEYFDYEGDLNSLVLISHPLKMALKEIAPDNTPTDDLVNIAIVFLGIWKACDSKNRISLKEIVNKVKMINRINLRIFPQEAISDECKSLLDAFEGLQYHITGRMFYWNFGQMSGNCPWTEEKEAEILRVHPTDKWELMELLS